MKKKILWLATVAVLTLLYPGGVLARKVLPKWRSSAGSGTTVRPGRVAVSVKFRSDRRGVVVALSNLGVASSVSYSLTYFSRGVEQGVDGAVKIDGGSATKDLIFGTCSTNGACRYDTGITDAHLTITSTLKNGTRIVKPFKLKV